MEGNKQASKQARNKASLLSLLRVAENLFVATSSSITVALVEQLKNVFWCDENMNAKT